MLTGHVISHYRLLDAITRDRDSVIYRARDLRLDRDVAIRVLSGPDGDKPQARERFRREARIASLVSHPHICAVHDSGEEDGHAFVVCELLEGRPLEELLVNGPLALDRVVELGLQMLDALAALHARGLVHGNLTPANVFVTTEDHVKLLDVGLMTAWWETTTTPATSNDSSPTLSLDRRAIPAEHVGAFHPYRSPEYVRGERLDHRADLFSAAAVLYEMATGRPPFKGDSPPEIAAAIVTGSHVAVSQRRPLTPAGVEAVIERGLEVAPDARYQSAADMVRDLRRARRALDSASGAEPLLPSRRSRPRGLTAAVVAALIVAAAVVYVWRSNRPAPTRHSILLGSIANGTNDPDFDGTLRQALSVHLGQSPFLDIVSDERLREILQMMGRDADAPLTHEVAREACQRLGLNAMVEGSVSAVGRLTAVALVATDCGTDETIRRHQIEVERKEEVLRAVGTLASSVRTSLGESVASLERHNVPIEEATTPSLEALKAYTAGVAKRAAGTEIDSIKFFERAIELDPRFALAYTTLSSIYGSLGETGRGEEYARRAYEHRETVSERERLFITYQYHDRVTGDQLKAREALEVWKQAYPRDYRPPNALAVLLLRLGDYERAIAEAEEAIRRNPSHPFPQSNLAYALRGAGRYDDARKVAEKSAAMRIETLPTRRLMYQLGELAGDAAFAQAQLQWARPRAQGFDLTGAHAQVLAFQGRMKAARDAYAETVTLARRNGFPQIATGYAAQAALTEALYGNAKTAIEQANAVDVNTTYAPRLRAAAAFALANATSATESEIRRYRDVRPEDTILHRVYLPAADAALHLSRREFDQVVEVLRAGSPYEHGIVAALLPMLLRGEAQLRSGAFSEAISEFQSVLQHRGADPFSPAIPLAQLGLARALRELGDRGGSARAYQELLAIWRDADGDVPVVRDARAEAEAEIRR